MDLAIESLFNSQFMNNDKKDCESESDSNSNSDSNTENSSESQNQNKNLSTCSLDSNNNNKQFEEELKQFNNSLLDPLSVIIKLAIISNKPVGTKLLIKENVIHIQEPGLFQGFARYISKTNRNDLQHLYNPIQFACQMFLNKEQRKKNPKMIDLFICAKKGILKLIETYNGNATIRLCLNYYYVLIDNYVKERYTKLFRKDETTKLYTDLLISNLNELWSHEKIKIVLDMIQFLSDDKMANDNVKSLDVFIQNMDKHTQPIISSQIQ